MNAPGRIGDPELGIPDSKMVVDMLLMGLEGVRKSSKRGLKNYMKQFFSVLDTDRQLKLNPELAGQQADLVDGVNDQRRQITEKIENEIEEKLRQNEFLDRPKVVIVRGDHWNSGVIGIDADRLRDRFKCPAIVVTDQGDSLYLKGSARSIPSIDVYKIMNSVQEKFLKKYNRRLFEVEMSKKNGTEKVHAFGGHSQACGFSFFRDDFEIFEQMVNDEVDVLPQEAFEFQYTVFKELAFKDINDGLIRSLDTLSPFGQHFEYPLFLIKNCSVGSKVRPFGNKYQHNRTPHVEFYITSTDLNTKFKRNQRYIACTGFNLFDTFTELLRNDKTATLDLIVSVDFSSHTKHRNMVKLTVEDMRLSQN